MPGDQPSEKILEALEDNAAQALAVVSVQKLARQPVPLGEPSEQAGSEASFPESAASEAKQGAYVFKAGSALPEARVEALNANQIFLVRYRDELHAIKADDLRAAFPGIVAQHAAQAGTVDLRKTLRVRVASSQSAVPELIGNKGSNNVVAFDGRFYVVPYSAGVINNWAAEDVAGLPGVAVARTGKEAFAIAAARAGEAGIRAKEEKTDLLDAPRPRFSQPRLVKTVEEYNIVEYEGWYYGMPHALGTIELEKVDVIEMPGVIRDVSADVVEREIQELKR
jgi:hypothetical protein